MIIAIGGKPGSGKSTVAKELAKRLGMKHYSAGDFMRKLAAERGKSLIELSKIAEKDFSIDDAIDSWLRKLAKQENDFVVDSRLAFHFIHSAVKIYLDVDLDTAAKRIFSGPVRKTETEKIRNIEALKEELKQRMESERKRYMKYYGVDIDDKSNYDLVIDTSNISAEEVVEKILRFLEERKKKF
ncbi:cytidylate kinase [Candidatus Woesearchaeota archaeon]|nr:MAG: cytidylate kinase [Candidatus Woesearchaeota archaeon]